MTSIDILEANFFPFLFRPAKVASASSSSSPARSSVLDLPSIVDLTRDSVGPDQLEVSWSGPSMRSPSLFLPSLRSFCDRPVFLARRRSCPVG